MKKIVQLAIVAILLFSFSGIAGTADKTTNLLTQGKWITRSGGYVPNPTFDASQLKEGETVKTTKRFKTLSFETDNTFLLDSAKQRYSGHYSVSGNKVVLHFKSKNATRLRKNTDPNNLSGGYATFNETVQLPDRTLQLDGDQLISEGIVYKNYPGAVSGLINFYEFSGFGNVTWGHIVMMIVGLFFIFLAIRYDFEPLLLIPIGIGVLIGNVPMFQATDFNLQLGVYEPGSVMNYLYKGVVQGWYPPLIFLGIGAMTDFSSLISNPKLMLLGAAAQIGIFLTFLGALWLGFAPPEAGAIGIIGGADGPTAIFLSSKLANGVNVLANGELVKNLIGPIAIAAYSYMALVPVIQPPVIKLLTSKKNEKSG